MLFSYGRILLLLMVVVGGSLSQTSIGDLTSYQRNGNRLTLLCSNGQVRMTFNTNSMVRIQLSPDGTYRPDNHQDYFMVQKYDWAVVPFLVSDQSGYIKVETDDMVVRIDRTPMRIKMYRKDNATLIAGDDDAKGMYWDGVRRGVSRIEGNGKGGKFGFGCEDHGNTGELNMNSGGPSFTVSHGKTVVPFFMSTAGYGIFLNTVSSNTSINGSGSLITDDYLDYWFMYGPDFKKILNLYSELTGRMNLYGKWAYGFMLSKYGNDNATQAEFLEWIRRLRREDYPTDVYMFDYGWRGGKCNPHRWDTGRFPNVGAMFAEARDAGFHVGLHNNKCTFDLYGTSFTNPPDVKKWVDVHMDNVIKPGHGDFFWPDEFDINQGTLNANRAAKAVYEAWEAHTTNQRPMFMTRGGFAGHHYATTWSGDIGNTAGTMAKQIVSTQAVGLSGYVFWSNDLGGFGTKPTNELYTRWVSQFGAFSSLMRTHGHDGREPWLYDVATQNTLRKYLKIRYRLFPYIYTSAWQGASAGIPMTRAMVLEYQDNPKAWSSKYQYFFGDWLLVAPALSTSATAVQVWLPEGRWYDFYTGAKIDGNKDTLVNAPLDHIPVFVRDGAIIPMGPEIRYADEKPLDTITLDVYPPAAGESAYTLYEDDGITRNYLLNNSYCKTAYRCRNSSGQVNLNIAASECPDPQRYKIPPVRTYLCKFVCATRPYSVLRDGNEMTEVSSIGALYGSVSDRWFYDAQAGKLLVKATFAGVEGDITFSTKGGSARAPQMAAPAMRETIAITRTRGGIAVRVNSREPWSLQVLDLHGRMLYQSRPANESPRMIPSSHLANKAVVVRVSAAGRTVTRMLGRR